MEHQGWILLIVCLSLLIFYSLRKGYSMGGIKMNDEEKSTRDSKRIHEEFNKDYKGRTILFEKNLRGTAIDMVWSYTCGRSIPSDVPYMIPEITHVIVELDNERFKVALDKIIAVSEKIDKCPHCGKALPGKD